MDLAPEAGGRSWILAAAVRSGPRLWMVSELFGPRCQTAARLADSPVSSLSLFLSERRARGLLVLASRCSMQVEQFGWPVVSRVAAAVPWNQ